MTELAQEYVFEFKEIECNLVDNDDNEYDNTIVCIEPSNN